MSSDGSMGVSLSSWLAEVQGPRDVAGLPCREDERPHARSWNAGHTPPAGTILVQLGRTSVIVTTTGAHVAPHWGT